MLLIKIHNDGTGSKAVGNYDIEVKVNDRTLWTGRVENHLRADGWKTLVRLLAVKL